MMKRSFKKAVLSLFLLAASCLIVSCRAEKKVLTAPKDMKAIEAPGMTIGVASGYIFDDVLVRAFPNADIRFYDSREEAYSALSCGEVNGVADDEGLIRARMRSDESIELLEGYVEPSDYALIFPKDEEGEKLRDAFNAYLSEAAADGTLEKLDRKWFGKETDNKQSEDVEALSAERGTLSMAFENPTIPFVYLSAGKPVGYEMDLIIGFCKENGYGLEAEAVDFVDVLTGVASSDYDLGASAITVTERRKEDLYFSDPDYVGGICICVNSEAERVSGHNGLGELKNDFSEAFVEGQRGKRLVSGCHDLTGGSDRFFAGGSVVHSFKAGTLAYPKPDQMDAAYHPFDTSGRNDPCAVLCLLHGFCAGSVSGFRHRLFSQLFRRRLPDPFAACCRLSEAGDGFQTGSH